MVDGGDQEQDHERAAEPAPTPAPPPSPGRRLRGYAVGGAIVLIAVVGAIALLAGGEGAGDDKARGGEGRARAADLLPDDGLFAIPDDEVESVRAAADAAGCELRTYAVESKAHVTDPKAKVRYSSSPPTSGRHWPVPAEDGAYAVSPPVMELVHTLEHSRVILWFERDLPRKARAALKAYYDHDSFLLLLVPDTTGMAYEVAATAWHRHPRPRGSGRLLGCPQYSDAVFTALELFKERNRGRGPEVIP